MRKAKGEVVAVSVDRRGCARQTAAVVCAAWPVGSQEAE